MSAKNPIPYVSGLALSQAQVDAMAQLSLSEEEISSSGTTHCAIIDLMERENQKTTLVPFFHKGERYYLLVTFVVPAFDGSDPKVTMPKQVYDAFRKNYGRGPNNVFDNLHGTGFRWPCVTRPDWLYSRMRETESYWRQCYERKKTQTKDTALHAKQTTGATGDAMEGIESSKA
ncbi:hypothetical protein BDZ89DRAFT_1158778 [Hymenopellis radicata]|nr:hypothetical protein BDZ89DRAFT_1158778 [Hymenopellis radicata]